MQAQKTGYHRPFRLIHLNRYSYENPCQSAVPADAPACLLRPSALVLPLFNRCTDQVEATVRYTKVTPVYETTDVLRNAVAVTAPDPSKEPAKSTPTRATCF